jgi:hypothetical protein
MKSFRILQNEVNFLLSTYPCSVCFNQILFWSFHSGRLLPCVFNLKDMTVPKVDAKEVIPSIDDGKQLAKEIRLLLMSQLGYTDEDIAHAVTNRDPLATLKALGEIERGEITVQRADLIKFLTPCKSAKDPEAIKRFVSRFF